MSRRMPDKYKLILLAAVFVIFPSSLFAAPLETPEPTIFVGEKIVFQVIWMGVPVGIGELEVKEKTRIGGRETFHIVATARANDFLSKIYPVHDEMHSYIDTQTLYPLKFRKKLQEGRYRADEETAFDAVNKKGHYESLKNGSKKDFEISGNVQDILSAFYWFRRQNIAVGQNVKTVVSSEEKDWELEVDVLRRETKAFRRQGSIDTIVIEPKTRLKGALYDRGQMWVNFSADKHRVPVWITLKTPFGSILGVLDRSASKFPYPFQS